MTFPIEFQKKTVYDSLKKGITIDAILRYGGLEATCSAKVDTGAEVCLFNRHLAELLEIDVENGHRENFGTLAGSLIAYGHEIEIETLDLRFQSTVFFAESYAVKRNLLGRQGWLQLVKLGLLDYDSEIYLSPRF